MLFSLIKTILSAQIKAPIKALDLPSFSKLTVTNMVSEYCEWYDINDQVNVYVKTDNISSHLEYIPSRIIITVVSEHGSSDITINDNTGDIMVMDWKALTGSNPVPQSNILFDSEEVKDVFYGLPGIVLCSPVIILNHFAWNLWEKMINMDRHAWSIWLRIKDQLEPKYYIICEKAFEKYKRN